MIPDPSPRLPDPYPSPGFSGPVQLVQSGDVDWRLTAPLFYRALDGTVIEVPRGASTDGASVPRPFSWIVPRSGRYLGPAVIHDRMYRVMIPAGQLTYQRADAILAEAMRLVGVSFLLRWLIWCAVRWAGVLARGRAGRIGWTRDIAAMLAMTLLALPVVALPSIVVAVGLAVWWVLEQLTYLVLLARGRSDRYVNAPRDLAKS